MTGSLVFEGTVELESLLAEHAEEGGLRIAEKPPPQHPEEEGEDKKYFVLVVGDEVACLYVHSISSNSLQQMR